jgi:hypothetical protein
MQGLLIEEDLLQVPEFYQLAELLNVSRDAVIGKCLRLWFWADTHARDGALWIAKPVIGEVVGRVDFADALASVNWFDDSGGEVEPPVQPWFFIPYSSDKSRLCVDAVLANRHRHEEKN